MAMLQETKDSAIMGIKVEKWKLMNWNHLATRPYRSRDRKDQGRLP